MKILTGLACLVLVGNTALASTPGSESGTDEGSALLSLSLDDDVQIEFGGRTHLDATWATGDDPYDTDDGVEFRRARLHAQGTLYELIDFKTEFDFAGGDADFRSVYMGVKDLCVGDLKVGHFKEPFSLEEQTSSRFITFNERSLANAFAPAYNTGVMLSDAMDNFTWAGGVFRTTDSFGNDNTDEEPDDEQDAEYAFTGRVTGTPWNDDEGASLLHLGAGLSLRQANDRMARFRSRPEAHLVNEVADTGDIAADDVYLAGGEVAWVQGPASLQGEYIWAKVEGEDSSGDADYMGYYVEGSWFLTGEHRAYKNGAFNRVKPLENKTRQGGSGAHQVALRYSMLDLDDGPSDDELSGITVGYNWLLNPNTAIKLNYIHSELDDGSSDESADIFLIRFQIDF